MSSIRSGLAGGLTDQAVVSLGNFGLNVVLARAFPVADYGVFSIVYSFVLFLNTLHQALITYPLSVRGAATEASRFEQLVCTAALLTPIAMLVWIPAVAIMALSIGHLGLVPLACAALLLWQLQEVIRRAALARAHYFAAIVGDGIRYFGALGAVAIVGRSWNIDDVFMILIASSAVAALPIIPTLSRKLRSAAKDLRNEIGVHWRTGNALLGANLLLAFSTQWFLWLLAWRQGPGGSAALMALATIAAVVSPILFGAENILVPEIARIRASLSFRKLAHLLRQRGLACAFMVAPLFGLIALAPETVLRLFYGHASSYTQYATALRILAAAYATNFASVILGAALRGYGAREGVFKMQLYPALLGVTLGSGLTWQFGLTGACVASLLAGLVRTGTGLYFVLRLRDLPAPIPDPIGAT